jgi:hypothetical protein
VLSQTRKKRFDLPAQVEALDTGLDSLGFAVLVGARRSKSRAAPRVRVRDLPIAGRVGKDAVLEASLCAEDLHERWVSTHRWLDESEREGREGEVPRDDELPSRGGEAVESCA